MGRKKVIKIADILIPDQLEEVSRMTDAQLEEVIEDSERPGIIKQYAKAIIDGQISDTLKIIKEVSKMRQPEDAAADSSKIEELAVGEDDEALYMALIKENVSQLRRPNTSPQEVARLSQNIRIFRKELSEARSHKPTKGSLLDEVLTAAAEAPKKKAAPARPKSPPKKKASVRKKASATKDPVKRKTKAA